MEHYKKIENMLHHIHLAAVSTVDSEGLPCSASVYYVMDEQLNFYFPTRSSSRKYKNIQDSGTASMCMTDPEGMKTLQLRGTATEVHDPIAAVKMIEQLLHISGKQQRSTGHWLPPIKQIRDGHFAIIKITPEWMRLGNFSEESRQEGKNYTQII